MKELAFLKDVNLHFLILLKFYHQMDKQQKKSRANPDHMQILCTRLSPLIHYWYQKIEIEILSLCMVLYE
jgi:hypothetical protein